MTTRRIISLVAIVFCGGSLAGAALTNGGFETGDLTGWTATGPVTAVTEQYARDFLGLTQPPAAEKWFAVEGEYFVSLWSTDSSGTDAASLSITFAAVQGEMLQFDYFFDYGDVAPYYDSATSSLTWAGGSAVLFEYNTSGSELGDDENIGWTHVSYSLPVADTYTLQFSTEDGGNSFESILGVDDVAVGTTIPAPGAIMLGTLGVGLLGWWRRRHAI